MEHFQGEIRVSGAIWGFPGAIFGFWFWGRFFGFWFWERFLVLGFGSDFWVLGIDFLVFGIDFWVLDGDFLVLGTFFQKSIFRKGFSEPDFKKHFLNFFE